MFQTINERVNVLASFKQERNQVKVLPCLLDWAGKRYKLETMGLYHPAVRGEEHVHVFEFSSGNTKFTLELYTKTLEWILAEVYYDYSA